MSIGIDKIRVRKFFKLELPGLLRQIAAYIDRTLKRDDVRFDTSVIVRRDVSGMHSLGVFSLFVMCSKKQPVEVAANLSYEDLERVTRLPSREAYFAECAIEQLTCDGSDVRRLHSLLELYEIDPATLPQLMHTNSLTITPSSLSAWMRATADMMSTVGS